MRKFLILLCLVSNLAFAWDGPPEAPGIGISRLLKPANYLDANGSGLIGPQPYEVGTLRGNFVLSQTKQDGKNVSDTWQTNVTLQDFHFEEQLPLSVEDGSYTAVPQNLRTVDAGLTYSHQINEQGKEWGLNITAGSESDALFYSLHEVNISATGTYRLPTDQFHGWVFFLNMATNRAFASGIPIPGAGYYSISPTNHTVVFIGIPFFFSWQPTEDWNFLFTYFIPTSVHSELSYKLSSAIKLHTDFSYVPQAWMRANLPDDSTRLIFTSARATAGVKLNVSEPLFFDFYGGYAFDQEVFEANSVLSSGITKTHLPAGLFVTAEAAIHL